MTELRRAEKSQPNGESPRAEDAAKPKVAAPAAASPAASAFPPIADYAFLSDCEVNALVAPSGKVEWMCVPRPDSPSVFAAMLDRAAGSFRFGPASVMVPAGRRYLPGTLVLETTWRTRTGWMVVREALCIGPWYHEQRRSGTHRRPPTDYEAEHILLRTARCIVGSVELSLDCEPVFDYGRTAATWEYSGSDYGEAIAAGGKKDLPLRLVTDLRVGFEGPGAHATKILRQGERAFAALVWPRSQFSVSQEHWAEHTPTKTTDEAFLRIERTADFWREWINRGEFPEHPWQSYLQRSALTLKGLTYSPTGALLAAPTTSLPETPGGERNWDYRYTWIRDSTFTLQALHYLNLDWEANEFMAFIADLERNEDGALQIMYGIDGRRDLTETFREELSGYDGAHPVRIGNGAFDQRQNDVFGAALDSVLLHTRRSRRLPRRLWPLVQSQAECATAVWRQPDQGIWEARGKPQHYVSSKLMCWVALDRAAKLATIRGDAALAAGWGKTATEIKADILKHGVDSRGVLRQHYATDALDASTLLAAIFGFLPGGDERLRASVLAIADELTENGFVLRYRTDETDDGLSGKEGTFVICSFWLVSALAIIGEIQRARDLMERLVKVASSLGLYAEEFDVATGRHLGNFPQAFSHLALVEAAGRIIVAERVAAFGG